MVATAKRLIFVIFLLKLEIFVILRFESIKMMNMKKIKLLAFVFASLTFLTGCDQVRQTVSDLINPPSPIEISRRVDSLVRSQKYQEAISLGEQYLNKNQDPEGLVTDAVTNAYMESGDAAGAVRHMQRSGRSTQGNVGGEAVTTTRTPGVAVDGASVTETKNGTVVRAGDAIVIMPK